jgi:CHAT domain-containing protein/tetratricopeptide (TPR) repeat protein
MSYSLVILEAGRLPYAGRRVSLLAVVLAATLGCRADPQPAVTAAEPPPGTVEMPRVETPPVETLVPGVESSGALTPGEFRVYALELPAGVVTEIEVDSLDIDLAVTLRNEGGAEIASLATQAFDVPEPLLAIADAATVLRLELRLGEEEDESGSYRLTPSVLRPATPTDALRLAAQRTHAKALALSTLGKEETNEQALAGFERALEDWRSAGDAAGTARSLYWSGLMLKDLTRYEEAEARFRSALELWRDAGSTVGQAETLLRLGALLRLWEKYEPALEAFDDALPAFREVGDRRGEAMTLYNQGIVHRRQASMQRALELYDRSRVIWQELGDRAMVARTINNIAVVRQLLGDAERAIEDLQRALAIYEEVGDTISQQIALNNIGWVQHRGLGDPGAAVDYFRRALRLAEESEDLTDQAGYLFNLARAEVDLGDPDAALADAERAGELARQVRNQDYEIGSTIVAGQARQARGELSTAAALFEEALAASRPLGLRSRESEALYHLARARRAQGRLDEALEAIDRSLTVLESVRAEVDSRSLKSTFLAFRRPYYELEVQLLVERARRDGGEAAAGLALEASERTRARGLLETLAAARADLTRGVDLALLDEELELRRQINEQDLLRWSNEGEERASADERLARLVDRLEVVGQRISRSSPQYAALARPRPLELDRVRSEVLDGESLLLEYSLGEDVGYLFAVTDSSIEIFDLPPLAAVEAAARDVYERLTDRQGWLGAGWRAHEAGYRRAAQGLSEMILGPVAGRLAGRRLLVAPEGALHFIPFAALPTPGAESWRPLVLDHEVVHLPSAATLAILRQRSTGRRVAAGALAVLADPVFGSDDPRLASSSAAESAASKAADTEPAPRSEWESGLEFRRLPHSRREAESIAALVEPGLRWVALDFEASRAAAMSQDLGRYRIVHFATHGFLNSRIPQLSGLTLSLVDESGSSVDGFLRLHEIYELELSADLVVLSACQTALGRAIRGEGLVGLVRGFLHSGAQSVIASLWQIEDDATARLMERVYSGLLRDGRPAAAALRQAQIELLTGEPRWRSPYFWAAFVTQGEWRSSG